MITFNFRNKSDILSILSREISFNEKECVFYKTSVGLVVETDNKRIILYSPQEERPGLGIIVPKSNPSSSERGYGVMAVNDCFVTNNMTYAVRKKTYRPNAQSWDDIYRSREYN